MVKKDRDMPLRASPQTAAIVQAALALCRRGDLLQAGALCADALKREPGSFDLLHLSGVFALQRGQHEAAAQFLNRALKHNPSFAQAHLNLGLAQSGLGHHKDALASFDRALALQPGYAAALNSRGNTLRALGRHKEALAAYDKLLETAPDATLFDNRGMVLCELRRFEEALASFDQALELRPGHAGSLSNRANVLRELGRHEEALESCGRALAAEPANAFALNNHGVILYEMRCLEEALASFDQARKIAPADSRALNIRGAALTELGRYGEARECFDRALALRPVHEVALLNRGLVLRRLGRPVEAIADFEQLLRAGSELEGILGYFLLSQLECCAWKNHDRTVERIRAAIEAGKPAVRPFPFLSACDSPALQLRCTQIANRDAPARPALWNGEVYGHDRIRIAYVSADFYSHATAHLMAGLFEAHDRSAFEITALSLGPKTDDAMRGRLERAFDNFIDAGSKSDAEIAQLLRDMEIDIAVDLKGYTQNNRHGIFAFRPAPVQINYLGYPGTMGADYVDYILADRFVIPQDRKKFYSEKVVTLPHTYQPNDRGRPIGENNPTRAEARLPESGFVFCSFNGNYKITPQIFDIWMRLLEKVEGSVLWLLAQDAAVANLKTEAVNRGIAPERLVFARPLVQEDHLARLGLADLLLDTLPVNGHTTTSDALWAGLPVLTCVGEGFAARVAGSLLHAVGLPELVTENLEDYEMLGLVLAREPGRLADIRARLDRNRQTAPLFDTDLYRRHLESAYRTIWERWQRGEPPAGFAVRET